LRYKARRRPKSFAYGNPSKTPKKREDVAMTTSLKSVKIAPKGMGLNDFVAHQEGYFAAEGLDVELDWKTFRGTQSS
jgi:ABC-type nitrate/sulfonate/bicarbonate transport system substrate-binding protein